MLPASALKTARVSSIRLGNISSREWATLEIVETRLTASSSASLARVSMNRLARSTDVPTSRPTASTRAISSAVHSRDDLEATLKPPIRCSPANNGTVMDERIPELMISLDKVVCRPSQSWMTTVSFMDVACWLAICTSTRPRSSLTPRVTTRRNATGTDNSHNAPKGRSRASNM